MIRFHERTMWLYIFLVSCSVSLFSFADGRFLESKVIMGDVSVGI